MTKRRVVLIAALWLATSWLWGVRQYQTGAQLGALGMQCIDFIAMYGPTAREQVVCQEARKQSWRLKYYI